MRLVLLPEPCPYIPFSSSSHGVYIQQRYWGCGRSCIGMKNSYIKKGTLPVTPEPISMYISSGIILPVSGGWNNSFHRQWRLNNNIMTYMIKPLCCNVFNLIMTHKCESPWRQIIAWSGEKDSPHTQ